jgi:predicted AAA+ superfamily ATPase
MIDREDFLSLPIGKDTYRIVKYLESNKGQKFNLRELSKNLNIKYTTLSGMLSYLRKYDRIKKEYKHYYV